jgi:erythromycin esterase-like protein
MTTTANDPRSVHEILTHAHPLTGSEHDFSAALEAASGKRIVLIGEATHGTHEFYRIRAELTKRLIRQLGFRAVVIEGDWPDAHRVNRYVRRQIGGDAEEALGGFVRFPQWMWRNADMLDFVGWLSAYNESAPRERETGIYGMDLYSLHASMEAVVSYLKRIDPDAALRAARRYACFDQFGREPQEYGFATAVERQPNCEAQVVQQLLELRAKSAELLRLDGRRAQDDLFFAEQNARVVIDAERYYRTMYRGNVQSWNVRDHHMMRTIEAIQGHLEAQAPGAKLVVWAHNSHLGDARATDMGRQGEVNIGQLARQTYGVDQCLLIGFTTYDGTVSAASDWGEPVERKTVRPALPASYEALFHETGLRRFYLDLRRASVARALAGPMLERAIGVIYHPETERVSHYFAASLPEQFDAVFHYDRTRAVEPLERTPHWDAGIELPETYPTAL